MEFLTAMKVADLIKERDQILNMRSSCASHSMSGWSFMVNDRKIPIPTKVKRMFVEAIEKALDHYNQEIEKL